MTLFSTILNSNNAGGRSLVEKWLEDHRFFIGVEETDAKLSINDDLSISISSIYKHEEFYPDLTINEIPPYGIKEIDKFHDVNFVNVTETNIDKLPLFRHCKTINMEYCTLPREYISRKMNLKECTLV